MHIAKVTRAMQNEKKMPNYFWTKAIVATTLYIMNRIPIAIIHDMTPEKNYIGRKLDILRLKVFGGLVCVHIFHERRTKVDKGRKMHLHWVFYEAKRVSLL